MCIYTFIRGNHAVLLIRLLPEKISIYFVKITSFKK